MKLKVLQLKNCTKVTWVDLVYRQQLMKLGFQLIIVRQTHDVE